MKTPIALSCLLTLALSISSPSYGQSFNEWNGYLEAKTFYKKGEIDSAAKRLILIAEHHSFLTIDSLKNNFPDSIDLFRFAIERFRKRDQAMQRPFRPRLAALMDSIYKEDQKGRTIFDGLHNADDASNYRFVDSILSIHGFMSESELGFYGSQTQFLVIQHSTLEEMEKWFPVLTKAVVKGNEDAVIKLLANGADPSLLDANGHNAMTWASASGFTHLEEIIRTRVEDEELFKKKYIDKSNVELETNPNPHEGETEQQDSIPPSQE
jgi:hypothetical protein